MGIEDQTKRFITQFMRNIALMFGPSCEVVFHDFTEGHEATIIDIVNEHVTGRTVGGCPSNLFFEEMKKFGGSPDDFPIYFNSMPSGKRVKSATTFIRNDVNEVVGAVCINFDVSSFVVAQSVIMPFLSCPSAVKDPTSIEKEPDNKEFFVNDVQQLLDHYMGQVQQLIGKPASMMSKEEKMEALAFLDKRGVMQIFKANVRLCEFFGISKFTLYTYLEEIRTNQN